MSKTKKNTIGKMSNTRVMWAIKPMPRIKDSKKTYTRKKKHKGGEDKW